MNEEHKPEQLAQAAQPKQAVQSEQAVQSAHSGRAGWVVSAILLVLLAGTAYMIWQEVKTRHVASAREIEAVGQKQRANEALASTVNKLSALLLTPPCDIPQEVDGYVLTTVGKNTVVAP